MELNDYQTEAKRTAPRPLDAYPLPVQRAYQALRSWAADVSQGGRGDLAAAQDAAALLRIFDRLIMCLGLAGEVGEVLDMVKKHYGHGHDLDAGKLCKEFGDARWYGAVLEDSFGFTSEEVCQANVAKLRTRFPEGFSVEASKARVDEKPRIERVLVPEVCTCGVNECAPAQPCVSHGCTGYDCFCSGARP